MFLRVDCNEFDLNEINILVNKFLVNNEDFKLLIFNKPHHIYITIKYISFQKMFLVYATSLKNNKNSEKLFYQEFELEIALSRLFYSIFL